MKWSFLQFLKVKTKNFGSFFSPQIRKRFEPSCAALWKGGNHRSRVDLRLNVNDHANSCKVWAIFHESWVSQAFKRKLARSWLDLVRSQGSPCLFNVEFGPFCMKNSQFARKTLMHMWNIMSKVVMINIVPHINNLTMKYLYSIRFHSTTFYCDIKMSLQHNTMEYNRCNMQEWIRTHFSRKFPEGQSFVGHALGTLGIPT